MGRIDEAFRRIREYQFARVSWLDAAERYVASGDRGDLARVGPTGADHLLSSLAQAIAPPPAWSDVDRRALHVLAAAQLLDLVFSEVMGDLIRIVGAGAGDEPAWAPM